MKSRTMMVLLGIHLVAFLMLFAGKIAPGAAGNLVVAVGMCVHFPGWFLGTVFFRHSGQGAVLMFAFVFNAVLYGTGGLLIDVATKRR